MSKPAATSKLSKAASATMASDTPQLTVKHSFWQLKTGTAKKLGKQAEGGIHYQFLADPGRKELLFSITGNDRGGFFSPELVPFQKVEARLSKLERGQSFPSKFFKEEIFISRSANNPAFCVAILRAEGLLSPAPDLEMQHVLSGDWENWKKLLLSETGKLIEIETSKPGDKPIAATSGADHTEHTEKRKTISLKRSKADESSAPQDSPEAQ